MKFNINSNVKIKLTEKGRLFHRQMHDELAVTVHRAGGKLGDYNLKEDGEGWSQWQLWHVMSIFGPLLYNGGTVPFETEIEIMEE